jgi:small subunit ribosomal protein S20
MANIKSQVKRNRQSEKARVRNKTVKSALKTEVKKLHDVVATGDKDAAEAQLKLAGRELDRAATKGILHKNTAANRKSGLAKNVASL